MSNVASGRPGLPPELDGLELAVRRLLEDHQILRRRVVVAERRARELDATLAQLRASSHDDPLALRQRIDQLEGVNRELQTRLDEGAERVRRLLARTHFLEEEK